MYLHTSERNVRGHLFGAATLLLLAASGCSTDDIQAPLSNDNNDGQRISNFQGHFEASGSLETACGTVAGIAMTASGPGASTVECDADFMSFDPANGTTEYDHVADCSFVVKPGLWEVDSLGAIDEYGNDLACCTSVLPPPVNVGALQTTEVQGAITCEVDQNGALDVIVTINVPPVIVDLTYTPSKFGATCEAILLHVDAQDADGGLITYTWAVTDSPPLADYELVTNGADASFATKTIGDYELTVTATDDEGASTYLEFPIHIVDDTNTVCDLAVVCALP